MVEKLGAEFRIELLTESSAYMPPLACEALGRLEAPTLLVTGERSPAIFLLVTAELEGCLEGELNVMVPEAGHGLQSSNPTFFNEAVLAFLDTPEMNRAPVQGGGELEYEIRGEGEPVLLIHGSLIAASFFPIMDEDALGDFRLIRYHRRGYAGSTAAGGPLETYIERAAADAKALLRHLGADRAHVVGHSYGGLVALQLAHDAPEVVHALVLLEPPLPNPSESYPEAANPPGMEPYRAGEPIAAVDQFLRAYVTPEWRTVVARTVPGGVQQAERDARTNFEIESPAWHRWAFDGDMAEKLSQPILYMTGSEGYSVPDFVRGWWPQMEHHVVPDATHALMMEDSEGVAEAIADFLGRHPF